MTCENSISMPVTPETKQRSNIPSFLSINMAPDVRATDKKKIMLKTKNKIFFFEFRFVENEKDENVYGKVLYVNVLVKIIK